MKTHNNLAAYGRFIGTAVMLTAAVLSFGQKKSGDYIESTSLNDSLRGTPRTMNYYPDGDSFTCVNGTNKYTRALYGGYTDYRIETSDRPIFAIYKKRNYKNVRFVASCGGAEMQLDSVSQCIARYTCGVRRYELSDPSWGGGHVTMTVMSPTEHESAIWRFTADGFADALTVTALVCDIASTKLKRSGDMGVDNLLSFEPHPDNKGLTTASWTAHDGGARPCTTYFYIDSTAIRPLPADEAETIYTKTEDYYTALAHRIVFSTPDPYINTLGSALSAAADGDWDGQTWLHGCVGWRMPLAGWRAGYLGDVLGWDDRARSHFDAYAASQVTDVAPTIPHPSQDTALNMARAAKKWGTQMYSNGYICRNPYRNDQMHHYDMNLNYMDELLWHFCYDPDTTYMRIMWPVITSHLAWEKRNYDPDNDCLYDAYCCIWASDALYYSGGAVTHSSAYNYRGNALAARIAEMIGEDGEPYRREAAGILNAMNSRLWMNDERHWAEYEDALGLKRLHTSAALWSVYTPIDCGAGTTEQFYEATRYIDRHIPHIPVTADDTTYGETVATTDWMPYAWSINNVAPAEVAHTALSFFEAGRADAAFDLLKADIIDMMYLGSSPGNFGQLSFYDAARGECYRDFGDCIGITARALLQGLFGIVPDGLYGRCFVRPGFPQEWDSASVSTPYLSYTYKRVGDNDVYEITQHFKTPQKIILRQNIGRGQYRDTEGTHDTRQIITVRHVMPAPDEDIPQSDAALPSHTALGLDEPTGGNYEQIRIDGALNASVTDIFRNKYVSPRSPYTTLQIPVQGIGEWCHPNETFNVNDSLFRTLITGDSITVAGVPFRTMKEGNNIAFTSLWDNYPDSIVIPLSAHAATAYLLMAGSTNHMQSRIDNGIVIATYSDSTTDTLRLINPDNWCPIEQDYYVDGKAFRTTAPRPYRISFADGTVSRDIGREKGIGGVYLRYIDCGAAQMLSMPLNKTKELQSITLRTLSNDVVIGLMGLTIGI